MVIGVFKVFFTFLQVNYEAPEVVSIDRGNVSIDAEKIGEVAHARSYPFDGARRSALGLGTDPVGCQCFGYFSHVEFPAPTV